SDRVSGAPVGLGASVGPAGSGLSGGKYLLMAASIFSRGAPGGGSWMSGIFAPGKSGGSFSRSMSVFGFGSSSFWKPAGTTPASTFAHLASPLGTYAGSGSTICSARRQRPESKSGQQGRKQPAIPIN